MPSPKNKASGAADALKVDYGNDSLDTVIRQTSGKEPFLSFSRANDSPVQWIHLLNALDQQDLGWPLLTPVKIQMQKCDKCSREFCSTINYRRHMRLHRRNLNLDKDSTIKNRGLLQAFWDKLCPEVAMEIMSFNDVALEGVSGSSIVKALTSFIRKPGFSSLPQSYVRSGSALLDIVQGRPSRFPMSSQELFSILDDASEKTFLCAGTAESLKKYVFDGEAGKIGLEMRNLVACTSFLVEQKLVKACLADKDAEALRYQKLLVEEEEAAQKRRAALLEKKRLKKLRQKEQRAKEQASAETDDSPEDSSLSPPTSSPVDTPDSNLEVPEVPHDAASSEPVQIIYVEADIDKSHENEFSDFDTSLNVYPDLGNYQNVENRTLRRSARRHTVNSRWQAPKLLRTPNGFHTSNNYQAPKLATAQQRASSRDSRTAVTNGVKVWTPKPKSDTDEESCKTRLQIEAPNLHEQDNKHEVLIGSISVTLGSRNHMLQDEHLGRASESNALELCTPEVNVSHERPVKIEVIQGRANRSTVKLWRPVSRHDNGVQLPIQNDRGACEVGSIRCNGSNQIQKMSEGNHAYVDGGLQRGPRLSSHAAETFLAKRWKEAITSDHVKLVLFTEARPAGCSEGHDENQGAVPLSKVDQRGILHSAENHLESYTNIEHLAAVKSKARAKAEKGNKVKYIPKQRSGY